MKHPTAPSWPDVIQRYTDYMQTPRWRGKTWNADRTVAAESLSAKQALRLRARLSTAVGALLQNGELHATVDPNDICVVKAATKGFGSISARSASGISGAP